MHRIVEPNPTHKVVYEDLTALLMKHAPKATAEEVLAIAANMVGKLVALQDQRTMSPDRAMQTVLANIEAGNREALAQMAHGPVEGHA